MVCDSRSLEQKYVVDHLDVFMSSGAASMEIEEVWGREIAIRMLVRKITRLGIYLDRG